MLKKSRIIAVFCASLNMLPWVFFTAWFIYFHLRPGDTTHTDAFLRYMLVPLLLSAVGLWGSLSLRKTPVLGAALMFVSGGLVFFLFSPYYSSFHYWWSYSPSLLLAAAGVLSLIGAYRTSGNKAQPGFAAGAAVASLNTLFWAFLPVFQPVSLAFTAFPLLVSAFGLWGSLLYRKKPLHAAKVMLVSGGLVFVYEFALWLFYLAGWLQMIPSLLLVAVGIFGIIAGKSSAGPQNEGPGSPVNN